MPAPKMDNSRYPLLTVTFEGLISDSEFDEYLAWMKREVLDRKQKNVTIFDARHAGRNPATQRRKQADWLKTHERLLRSYSLGTAFVITSPLIRGALTAILWLQPMPSEHVVVSTLEQAEQWALRMLQAAGIPAPPPAPRLMSQ